MPLAKVTSKGQITIPAEIRKAMDIEQGDTLSFDVSQGNRAVVKVIKGRKLSDLYGALAGPGSWPGKRRARTQVGTYLAGRRKGKAQ